jgi:predicted CoA-binding protein
MNALDFIDSVVPSGGTYCIIGVNPTKKEPNQKFATSLTDVQKIIDSIDQTTTNTAFCGQFFQ